MLSRSGTIGGMNDAAPARRLLEYLRAWQTIPASATPASVRADANGDWWTPSVDAVRCLVGVEELVENLSDPEVAQSYALVRDEVRDVVLSTRWALTAFAHNNPGGQRTIDEKVIAVVASIVSNLEFRAQVLAAATETKALVEFLVSLRNELTSADLDEKTRGYLLVLVSHLEQALIEAQVRGTADVASSADQLIGALQRLYVQSDGDEAKKTSGVVKTLTRKISEFLNSPFVSAVIGGAVGSGIGQITTG